MVVFIWIMQNNLFPAWFSGRKSYNCPCIIRAWSSFTLASVSTRASNSN